MIRHVAVFRFVPTFGAAERAHWMDLLRALPAQIPELRSISVGTDVLAGPFSHELAIAALRRPRRLEAYNRTGARRGVRISSARCAAAIEVADAS